MAETWKWVAGGLTAAAAGLFIASSDAPEPDDAPPDRDDAPENERGRDLIPELCERAGIDGDIATLLNFIARGESGWNPRVGRGLAGFTPPDVKIYHDPTEAHYSALAYRSVKRRHPSTLEGCRQPPEHYTWGSGGLFAALPVYWVHHFRSTPLRCESPLEVFDPPYAIAGAYSFARGIQRHSGYEGSVKSLRAGWGSLKRMSTRNYARKLPKWRKHARAVGKPESYIDGPAPNLPRRDLYELYQAMGGRL